MGANIPLPALGIKQQESPLDNYAKAMSIRGAQQQQQENSLDIQQKQQAFKDQQTVRATLGKYQGDMDKALPELAGQVSPVTYNGLVKMHNETMKEKMDLDTKSLDLKMKHNDQFLGLIDQAKNLPPDQYAAQYPQIAAQAIAIRPDLKGKIDPSQPMPQEALDSLSLGLMTDQQYNAKVKMAQEARAATDAHNSATAQLPGQQAKSDQEVRSNAASQLASSKDQAEYESKLGEMPYKIASQFPKRFDKDAVLQAGMSPHEQASVPEDKLAYKDWYQQQKAKGLPASHADFLVWKAKNSPTMMMSSNLQLTPEAVKMAGDLYQQTGQLPGGLSRAPQVTASVINSAAKTADGSTPDIAGNKIQYASQKALDTEYFGRGKTFQNIRSLNTAVGHLGRLYDAAEALNNGDISKLNEIGNSFNLNVKGQSPTAVFNAIKTAATGELGSTFKGSAATDPEIAQIAQTINSNLAGNVNKDVVKEDLHLLGSRLSSIDEQYAQNSRSGRAPKGKILFGQSQRVLNKTGVKLDEGSGSGPKVGDTQSHNGANYKFDGKQWVKQ